MFVCIRNSLHFAIQCLKRVDYDRAELERRRRAASVENTDVVVWTNERVQLWLRSVGLAEFAPALHESGVHGALIALDDSFHAGSLLLLLQIPATNQQVIPSQIPADNTIIHNSW